ncbi:MAG TPA: ATP-dependent DNA helicase [Verrucomicrobiae bacterium]|nr:ATP-dependent DNA helicase [Verrucomicrobiae bacterium]
MRFDETARVFELSVRELAESDEFRRIGFERGEGWHRLGLGAELHARVLRDRCAARPAYRREVHLQHRWPVEDWTALVTGRLDGCVPRENAGWLIEEFKSAYLPGSGAVMDHHKLQLLIYCHLWSRLGNSPVTGALVYVDLASAEEFCVPVDYDEDALERRLQARLRALLAIWRAEAKSRERKAAAACVMPFPHNHPRPGQQLMIDAVRETLATSGNLLAEAPTGSGKTAASLYPALAHGVAAGRQVVFLTPKTLQQKMAVTVLRGLNRDGAFRTAQIRAKEKMCANDRVLCHEDFCPYAKDYPAKMEKSAILDRLRDNNTHYDPDTVFAEAKKEKVCPFEVQLELAGRADAIVADYNYVFDPGAALGHLDREGLGSAILLVDEAHNLADRARAIFSPELLETAFRDVSGRLLLQAGELFEALTNVVDDAASVLRKSATEEPVAEIDPPAPALRELWKQWEPVFVRYLSWKRETKLALADDPIVDLHFAWQRFMAILNLFGSGFACVAEKRPDGTRLALVCLDPARAIAPIFRAAASSILFSATLSPVETTRRTLGLEKDRTASLNLPPPFPRENRKVMILPQVRTTFSARAQNFGTIAGLVAEMSDAQSGNVLVLFPSYEFLDQVARKMPPTRAALVVQRPNLAESEREAIFKALASSPRDGVLLFAVLGGMYAEGVDYPGELLTGVYVVSPALPKVSFERELLRRYFDETEQAGFEYAYLQPGMTRVIQAAGRLIRSETDRGVIALLCQRFLQEPYASRLPRDWYDESPLELISRSPAQAIQQFFKRPSQ